MTPTETGEQRERSDAAALAERVRQVVEAAPPLTDAQREKLTRLLAPAPARPAEQRGARTLAAEYETDPPVGIRALAKRHGMSYTKARNLIQEGGGTLRPPPQSHVEAHLRAELARTLAAEYEAEPPVGIRALAKRHGMSYTKARSLIREGGGTLRPHGGHHRPPEDWLRRRELGARLVAEYERSELSISALARKNGMSASRTRTLFREAGATIREFNRGEVFSEARRETIQLLLKGYVTDGLTCTQLARREYAGRRLSRRAIIRILRRSGVELRQVDAVLTPREHEVARLVGEGMTNRKIATRLKVKETTVSYFASNALAKLGLHSRVQLTRWAAALSTDA